LGWIRVDDHVQLGDLARESVAMEIRWLEAFVAVAEELHFGRAAARLRLAQSPLSQTIRRLERELGVALFDRSTRSVALTPAGQALLPHAHRIFEELELARQSTRAMSGVVYGTLSIGFSGALNHLTLPPLTRAVRRRYPDVTLKLVGRVMTRDGVEQVERGSLDLAFVALPLAPSPVVRTRMIARVPLGAALPVDHDWRRSGRSIWPTWPTTTSSPYPCFWGRGCRRPPCRRA
jgi:DNA-binding transcriptional LysR family regulator